MPQRLSWDRDGRDWPNRESSRFLRAGGVDWHVQVMGPAGGEATLLLHGAGASSHSFRSLAPILAATRRVIVPDLPGHAFTPPPVGRPLSLEMMAESMTALCAALEAAPALIVGHSAGAAVGARMAMHRPAPLAALNGALTPFRGAAGILFPVMAKMLAANPFAARAVAGSVAIDRLAVGRLLRGMGAELDARGRALYQRLVESPGHVSGALGMMAAWDLERLLTDLPRLRSPVLLLAGDRDRAVPAMEVRRAAALIPQAELRRATGMGHLMHEEAPERFAAEIEDWAERLGSPAPAAH